MNAPAVMPPSDNRRAFIRNGTLLLGAAAMGQSIVAAADTEPLMRIGLVTDLHHADKPPRGSRHYRESLGKLAEAGEAFEKQSPEHVVELGDFIDAADSVEEEQGYLRSVQKSFVELPGKKHHVLGNHCVHTLTKEEFLAGVERDKSHYSFDHAGYHFVILDSCFRSDGVPYGRKNFVWTDANIPAEQLEWLEADLKSSAEPTIVFAHQRLDPTKKHSVKNASAVRTIFEQSARVKAVFQGHSHKNDYREINGIHYTTLVAMVEGGGADNNGYSVLSVLPQGVLSLTGFRRQQSHKWLSA